jgi:hypothetical protein
VVPPPAGLVGLLPAVERLGLAPAGQGVILTPVGRLRASAGAFARRAQQAGDGLADRLGGGPAAGAGGPVAQLPAQAGQAGPEAVEVAGQRAAGRPRRGKESGHVASSRSRTIRARATAAPGRV